MIFKPERISRVEYYYDRGPISLFPAGWYICDYTSIDDLLKAAPAAIDGPYQTQAEAARLLRESQEKQNAYDGASNGGSSGSPEDI